MERLAKNKIDDYIKLHNQLSFEDPYILRIDKDEFIKNNYSKIESGNIDIFILNVFGQDIGFLEILRETQEIFIESIFLIKEYRSADNYRNMFEFLSKLSSECNVKKIKFIGVCGDEILTDALTKCGYIIKKEHLQMEKNIGLQQCQIRNEYRGFSELKDGNWIYGFMKECMAGSIFNYSEDEVKKIIADREYNSFIVYNNRQAVGFGISYISKKRNVQENEKVIYIEQIAVHPEYRNNKQGREIVEFLIMTGKTMGMERARLHVYKDNKYAYKLYEDLGFEIVKSIDYWERKL